MFSNMFWSIGLRTGQVAIESCATLLCGLVVAGIMRQMMGAAGTRRLFGGPGWSGLLRAWAVGTVLPVCSLGVIPIAREMRRAGVRGATILAFIMAAPHINPLSLLYGLTMSEPLVIICFAIGSLIIALAAGVLWDRLLASDRDIVPIDDEPLPPPGLKRLLAVLVATARESVGPSMGYVLIGLLSTGVIAGIIPHGSLALSMRHDDPLSPILMAAVALPLYIGALPGMMRIGLMFEHGNSAGAAFVLFELGIGLNIGTAVWLIRVFGWRRTLSWLFLLALSTLALAHAAERTLYFAGEEVCHTHAFDDWTNPFIPGMTVDWPMVGEKLLAKVEVLEPASLAILAVLVLTGLLLGKLDPRRQLEAFLTRPAPPSDGPAPIWNRSVPGVVLGLIALLGLVSFSVVGLYVYYPTPQEALTEITDARVLGLLGVRSGNKEEALHQIQRWDLLTRKLQVGVFIRTGAIDPEQTKVSDDLRECLEELRDAMLADDIKPAKNLLPKVDASYRQFRAVFESKYPMN